MDKKGNDEHGPSISVINLLKLDKNNAKSVENNDILEIEIDNELFKSETEVKIQSKKQSLLAKIKPHSIENELSKRTVKFIRSAIVKIENKKIKNNKPKPESHLKLLNRFKNFKKTIQNDQFNNKTIEKNHFSRVESNPFKKNNTVNSSHANPFKSQTNSQSKSENLKLLEKTNINNIHDHNVELNHLKNTKNNLNHLKNNLKSSENLISQINPFKRVKKVQSESHSDTSDEKLNAAVKIDSESQAVQPTSSSQARSPTHAHSSSQKSSSFSQSSPAETRIIHLNNKNVPAGIHFAIAIQKNVFLSKNALKKVTRKIASQHTAEATTTTGPTQARSSADK